MGWTLFGFVACLSSMYNVCGWVVSRVFYNIFFRSVFLFANIFDVEVSYKSVMRTFLASLSFRSVLIYR